MHERGREDPDCPAGQGLHLGSSEHLPNTKYTRPQTWAEDAILRPLRWLSEIWGTQNGRGGPVQVGDRPARSACPPETDWLDRCLPRVGRATRVRALLLAAACGRLHMIDLTIMLIKYTAGRAKRVRVCNNSCTAEDHRRRVADRLFDGAQRLWYTGTGLIGIPSAGAGCGGGGVHRIQCSSPPIARSNEAWLQTDALEAARSDLACSGAAKE